jgi:tripartite-type tricarboxylate transporter receptor subunit TctC
VNQLNSEIVRIMKSPEMQKRLLDIGAESRDYNAQQFAQFIESESQTWGKIIHSLQYQARIINLL